LRYYRRPIDQQFVPCRRATHGESRWTGIVDGRVNRGSVLGTHQSKLSQGQWCPARYWHILDLREEITVREAVAVCRIGASLSRSRFGNSPPPSEYHAETLIGGRLGIADVALEARDLALKR